MKIKQFDKFDELLKNIAEERNAFGFLAGGTDLMPVVYKGELAREVLYDLEPFEEELSYITINNGTISIGAMTRLSDIANNEAIRKYLPQLAKAIGSIGSKQIRNMGTLAGNVANASPIGDTIPVLLTKDAMVKAINVAGEREIPIQDFFLDYKKTALAKNELIKSISLPFNRVEGKYDFIKVAIRPEMAMSKVNLAYALEPDRTRLAAGGVFKMPIRLLELEKHWQGKLNREKISEILQTEISPIDDLKSSSEYRRKVLTNLLASLLS